MSNKLIYLIYLLLHIQYIKVIYFLKQRDSWWQLQQRVRLWRLLREPEQLRRELELERRLRPI